MNVFFIADTHFGHANIIKYENRPYGSVEEMDEDLIRRWNETVNRDDLVFMLGDFALYNREKTEAIVKRLKGKIALVMGNHDGRSPDSYYKMGFYRVYDMPILYEAFWILSHEPMYINENMPYANIFGHVHGNREYVDYSSQSFCASVERIGYAPVAFEEIKKKMGLLE